MRLWSIHPQYLDTKGLLAVWREGLLAQKVLQGNTNGYKNHSQLIRFKQSINPIKYISLYLMEIWKESDRRGYNFNPDKITDQNIFITYPTDIIRLEVTKGQLVFEINHLQKKLFKRDFAQAVINLEKERLSLNFPKPHPLFEVIDGDIELWEKI